MDALFTRAALSVLEELEAGRHVDPARIEWARKTLAQEENGGSK
jgi:hypothetical protein